MKLMFHKILIANRGEIAVRIIRACREMGIQTVAVYSEADKDALHTMLADEAVCIGPAAAKDSYLSIERIMSAVVTMAADAVHPGFGFLSENSRFAEICSKCGITFIGPTPEVMESMGNKAKARNTMLRAGVPVVPGSQEIITDAAAAKRTAKEIGYPVMIKAALGGGGKGMRIAWSEEELEEQFELAQREAIQGFSDSSMYLERYIEEPKHIEFQIMADKFGNVVHLGERDCSVQRRHQKMLEESPSASIDQGLRERMGKAATAAAKACGYQGAGTVEFLVDKHKNFYFIEMNTRIQVEHPVTEMVTGLDLIKEQIGIAAGERLSFSQNDIRNQGHALECRINAEDPKRQFMPSPGQIKDCHFPGGCGVRVDTAIYNGYRIPSNYDSMIAKIIVRGKDRAEAIRKMEAALSELTIEGVTTNQEYLLSIITHPVFLAGQQNTGFIEEFMTHA